MIYSSCMCLGNIEKETWVPAFMVPVEVQISEVPCASEIRDSALEQFCTCKSTQSVLSVPPQRSHFLIRKHLFLQMQVGEVRFILEVSFKIQKMFYYTDDDVKAG